MELKLESYLLWGFWATLVLTALLSVSQSLRLTRLSLPFLLGSIFTSRRDLARTLGFVVHLMNGWIFSLLYVATFHVMGGATLLRGVMLGLVHAAFVLTVGFQLMPGVHPRMASEMHGPTATRQLEPPGFLARHYGRWTPAVIIVAHAVFGGILGAFYR